MKKTTIFLMILFCSISVIFSEENCIDARKIVYPYPQEICLISPVPLGKTFTIETNKIVGRGEIERLKEYFYSLGLEEKSAGGDIIIKFNKNAPFRQNLSVFRQEGYTLNIIATTEPKEQKSKVPLKDIKPPQEPTKIKPIMIEIGALENAGFFYAYLTLTQLIENGKIYLGKITDYPNFPIRGILEGGYGVWTYRDRIRILKWMGSLKMNTFMYAPKEGEKFRRRWRAPYDDWELREFMIYKKICEQNHIDFVFTISPAQTMVYSNPEEFERLINKYEQIRQLGIKNFSIFFDDVLPILAVGDENKYESVAEAQVEIANKLYDYLKKKDPRIKFSFCPTLYWGADDVLYNRKIRELLNPEIQIGWTGMDIVASSITIEDTKKFLKTIGRKPAIGDNWSRITVHHRDLNLYETTDVYINNPYSFGFSAIGHEDGAQLSRFVNSTLADYSWNGKDYDPETSLEVACIKIVGKDSAIPLKRVLEIAYKQKDDLGYSHKIATLLEEIKTLTGGHLKEKINELKKQLEEFENYKSKINTAINDPFFKNQINRIVDISLKRINEALQIINSKRFEKGEDVVNLLKELIAR